MWEMFILTHGQLVPHYQMVFLRPFYIVITISLLLMGGGMARQHRAQKTLEIVGAIVLATQSTRELETSFRQRRISQPRRTWVSVSPATTTARTRLRRHSASCGTARGIAG